MTCLFPYALGAMLADDKPNVVIILTDQQSYNMVAGLKDTHSGEHYAHTPNLDRLVKKGISFTNTYCANPVSVPSRFSIFTGLYGSRFSIRNNQMPLAKEEVVRHTLRSHGMGHLFKQAGYSTIYGGKVHLPYATSKGESKYGAPVSYGFDTFLCEDQRDVLGRKVAEYLQNIKSSDKPFVLVASFINPHDICTEARTNLSSNVEVDPRKPEVAETVNMMRERIRSYDSLFFYQEVAPQLPSNTKKTNNFPSKYKKELFKDFPDYYWRRYRYIYREMVSLVDSHIGEILDVIDANPYLKENTLIVFTSDHGEMQGSHHAVTKNLPFEECQKVPLIFAGYGVEEGNVVNTTPVCNGVDLLPTLCDYIGVVYPSPLDGLSLKKIICGDKDQLDRGHLFTEGDGFYSIICKDLKYTWFDELDKEMLINLKTDKGEIKNIAEMDDSKTDIQQMKSLLQQQINKLTTDIEKAKTRSFSYSLLRDEIRVQTDKVDDVTPKLYDLNGNLMQKGRSIQHGEFSVDIKDLLPDIYILSSGEHTRKIIISQ